MIDFFAENKYNDIELKYIVHEADKHESVDEFYRMQNKNNFSGKHKREIQEEKLSSLYCGCLPIFFRGLVLLVISVELSSIYKF